MKREKFSSRLGFILISAGCAIGLGNVWRFPYIVGKYGGAAFVLIYLLFLVILGLPIMVMEFSVGRSSRCSAALSFDRLEPKGTKWHWYKFGAMAGPVVQASVLLLPEIGKAHAGSASGIVATVSIALTSLLPLLAAMVCENDYHLNFIVQGCLLLIAAVPLRFVRLRQVP